MRLHKLRNRRARGLAVCALATAGACTGPHTLISARHTSCPPRKLEIRDLTTGADREDWIAVCDGKQSYACSTRERGRRLIYSCRPLALANDAGALSAPSVSDASAGEFDPP